jgi:hypothetical protein
VLYSFDLGADDENVENILSRLRELADLAIPARSAPPAFETQPTRGD